MKTLKHMPVALALILIPLSRHLLPRSQRRARHPVNPTPLPKGTLRIKFLKLSTAIRTASRTHCTRSEVDSKVQ